MYKEYLGDGIYAEFNEFREIVLTTENGINIDNTIYLDLNMMQLLHEWKERILKELEK